MNGHFLFRKRKRKWGFDLAWYHHASPCRKAAHTYTIWYHKTETFAERHRKRYFYGGTDPHDEAVSGNQEG
jgi:hypothetical protein